MRIRRPKCGHCDLANDAEPCPGQANIRVCHLADPARAPEETPPGQPMPGLLRRAANFARAVVAHVVAGGPTAPPDVQAERLAICRSNDCGFYREGDRCGHGGCGCFLATKTAWAEQACPLIVPKWRPVAPAETDTINAQGG